MGAVVSDKEKVHHATYNDYLTHEPGEDDFVDVDEEFKMIHEEIDRIYRENGDLQV